MRLQIEGALIQGFFILQGAVHLKPNVFVDLACKTQIFQNFAQLYV